MVTGKKPGMLLGLSASFALIAMLLCPHAVYSGAADGLEMCLYTVIPALFPFIFLSSIVNRYWSGIPMSWLCGLRKICKIPQGYESILLLGLLGGYPIGAKAVSDAYAEGKIDRGSAVRMLGFCNNAGPAFIFGIIGQGFSNKVAPLIIWCIHLISALLVGILLPYHKEEHDHQCIEYRAEQFRPLQNSIHAMTVIGGCVVLSCVMLSLINPLLSHMPLMLKMIISGMLELTSGSLMMLTISNEALRFIGICCLLSFGGLCVAIQTYSISGGLRSGAYLPGKLLQTVLTLAISACFSYFLFPEQRILSLRLSIIGVAGAILLTIFYHILRRK